MLSGTFWVQALERALKTAAQFSIFYLVGANTAEDSPVNFFNANFRLGDLIGFAASGFVLSLLTSIASRPIGQNNSPSLVDPTPPAT